MIVTRSSNFDDFRLKLQMLLFVEDTKNNDNSNEISVFLYGDANSFLNLCLPFISFSMVLQLIALHSRFPSDIGQIVSYVSENIATYLIPIKPNYHVGNKMCFVDTGIHSSFTNINCLPCKDFTSCEKQMVRHLSLTLCI